MPAADIQMLPRLLFITSEAPHSLAAGSIVFHRLLSEYPQDRLCVVTNNPPPAGAEILGCRYATARLPVDRLNHSRFWLWRPLLRTLGGSRLLSLRGIKHAVGDFQPDLVVTLLQDSWYYDLASRYARRLGLPFWVVIHDLPAGFEAVPASFRRLQQRRDVEILRQAEVRLCISVGMACHLSQATGLSYDVMLPPRAAATPSQSPSLCRELKNPGRLTLGYAGGLHYGYGEQLLQMLPALRSTGSRLEIFGHPPAGRVSDLAKATDVLTFHPYASQPEKTWRKLLERCDVVLQPYLLPPDQHRQQYQTHFPSKLGDCLTLGLPLLITGPSDASGVVWCLAHPGSALVVSDSGTETLVLALRRLQEEPELRVRLAETAQRVADAFSAETISSQLMRRLLGLSAVIPSAKPDTLVECRVPTYRRARLLERALRSLQSQTHANWRAVVIDDSPDREGESVVCQLADARIIYRPNATNLGAAGNLDLAFAPQPLAGGKYAAVLEDDNALHPSFFERGIALLASSRHAIISFNQRQVDLRSGPSDQIAGILRSDTEDMSWTPGRTMLNAFLGKTLPNGGYFWLLEGWQIDLSVGRGIKDAQLQEYLRQLKINRRILLSHEALSDWSVLPEEDLRRGQVHHRTFAANQNQLGSALIRLHGLPRLQRVAREADLPAPQLERFDLTLAELSLSTAGCRRFFWRHPVAALRTWLRLRLYATSSADTLICAPST